LLSEPSLATGTVPWPLDQVAEYTAYRVDTPPTINGRLEKDQDIGDSSMLKHGVLPVPAVFAIDRKGVIKFAYTNADYKVRLPADELLAVARQIAAAD
jgi:hypothetical protein